MAVTATTVAAATTMLAAVAAVFLTLVLCFYIFLCAKRYHHGGSPSPPPGSGVRAWLRAVFGLGNSTSPDAAASSEWCYEGGLDEKSMAKLPRREVGGKGGEGEEELPLPDCCAVCITELVAGETARVLPRCGHAFHVDCVDMWLRSHSTCPLCRRHAVDDPPVPVLPPAVHAPEADPESPNFPTNVLFFGSQDDVSTGRSNSAAAAQVEHVAVDVGAENAARACGLRRLIGCGGATTSPTTQPPPHRCDHRQHRREQEEEEEAGGDIEMGLAGGESSASRPGKPAQPGS